MNIVELSTPPKECPVCGTNYRRTEPDDAGRRFDPPGYTDPHECGFGCSGYGKIGDGYQQWYIEHQPMGDGIPIDVSKRGLPCLWETGGGRTNTGDSVIIASPEGDPIKPIYTRNWGQLACENHAMIPVKPGCYIIRARHHRGDFVIFVNRITAIATNSEGSPTAYAVPDNYFSKGEWYIEPHPFLLNAIDAAKAKALCYHCREPHFVAE